MPNNFSKPPIPEAKVSITIRIDADILRWFKAEGAGWQTRINDVLKLHYENSFIHHPIKKK
jgi:uncharacterized protein (DUF4415 family)